MMELPRFHRSRKCPRVRILPILNPAERFPSFVHVEGCLEGRDGSTTLTAQGLPRKDPKQFCSGC
jgi:hypothetical protein